MLKKLTLFLAALLFIAALPLLMFTVPFAEAQPNHETETPPQIVGGEEADPADWPWVHEVKKYCRDSLFLEQRKWPARINSLKGLFTGDALSIPYYANKEMSCWVRARVNQYGIRHAMVFSSSMAQFVLQDSLRFERKIVDFVDVDSDKWQQYSEKQPWPMNWLRMLFR